MQADNFRHLFRVVEVALDSIFNHFTQVTQRVGFGCNSMTKGGSNKASIDRILCDRKDNFHAATISYPSLYGRASFIEPRPQSLSCMFWLPQSSFRDGSQCDADRTRALTFHLHVAIYFRSAR